ncbi:hypothetical protein LINPERHAP2_LOCUS45152 [Linum perenne]
MARAALTRYEEGTSKMRDELNYWRDKAKDRRQMMKNMAERKYDRHGLIYGINAVVPYPPNPWGDLVEEEENLEDGDEEYPETEEEGEGKKAREKHLRGKEGTFYSNRPRALGRSAGSFPVVLFPNEKDARKRYAQRAEDPLRLYVVSVGNYLERYYESSVPDSFAAAIWFTGTTKKSHAYVTVTDGLIILGHEDPSRASGFHSHHHIDDKSPRALP